MPVINLKELGIDPFSVNAFEFKEGDKILIAVRPTIAPASVQSLMRHLDRMGVKAVSIIVNDLNEFKVYRLEQEGEPNVQQ